MHKCLSRRALSALIGASMISSTAISAELQPVDVVLARISRSSTPAPATAGEPAKLLQDIVSFREKSAAMPAERAAKDWIALWERTRAINSATAAADYSAFDTRTGAALGLRSVIAALPPPAAWPALHQHAGALAKKAPDDAHALGLQLLTELLTGDAAGVQSTLANFERLANAGAPAERQAKRVYIDYTRALVAKLYGSREQIADGFKASLDAQAPRAYGRALVVPDLVGLLGEEKAEALLRLALTKPIALNIAEGEATRALARKLALAEIATLRKPQWSLIDSIGTANLYEAMQIRFDPAASSAKSTAVEEAAPDFDYERKNADAYYFLDMVVAGRQDDAERALTRAAGGAQMSIPKQAMNALARSGKQEALYSFLEKALERRPQLQAWDVYLKQAAQVGRSKEAIALIDSILRRPELPAYLNSDLRARRVDAWLAADQTDLALPGLREMLLHAPSVDDDKLEERYETSIRVASLGRILKQPALAKVGLDFAKQALALPEKQGSYWRTTGLGSLFAELRRQGLAADAQSLALIELERETADRAGASGFGSFMAEPAKRAALVELVGIYDASSRSADVLRLLNEAGSWASRDLLGVISEKDSLGVPLGLMTARALKASGNTAAARTAVRVLLDRMPGYDPAYMLFVELNAEQAISELDRLYALDQFQERPLIWKAVVQSAARNYSEAEITARRAIAIDPSDGEQGANDRMRVYATLAEILEGKGDTTSAKVYRNAVAAIRISEQSDEFFKLGLYQRAVAGYRLALDQFSDAYCIQSRMAVQLGKMGQHGEALKHYQRAYELMPESFGRVESHCFGCESVFADTAAQSVAERVFTDLVKRGNVKPQAPYMLGYLRKEQGRFGEAVALFRQAVALDAQYLNAWKNLHELGEKTYIEASERDIARLKLFSLDPRRRHVSYELNEVADLRALWNAIDRAAADRKSELKFEQVYPLARSVQEQDQGLAKLPVEMQTQMKQYVVLQTSMIDASPKFEASPTLAAHALVKSVLGLMGERATNEWR